MGKKPSSSAYVLGVGLTKFIKPRGKGRSRATRSLATIVIILTTLLGS